MKETTKRVLIDTAGYLLILGGILLSPVPGPGGIPVILAGLALLSINNKWAMDLREYLLQHGGKLAKVLFPKHPIVVIIYDILTVLLLVLVTILFWKHAAIWQLSLSIILFFLAVLIAGMNRDRAARLMKSLGKH